MQTSDGRWMLTYEYFGSDNVHYKVSSNPLNLLLRRRCGGNEHHHHRASYSGKLLTVAGGSAADGAQVVQRPDQNLLAQQWSPVQVSGWPT